MVKRISVVFDGRLRKKLEGDSTLKNSLGMQSAWKFISDVMMINFAYHLDRDFVTFKEIKIFSYCHGEGDQLERAFEKSTRIVAEIYNYHFPNIIGLNVKFFDSKKNELFDVELGFDIETGKLATSITTKF